MCFFIVFPLGDGLYIFVPRKFMAYCSSHGENLCDALFLLLPL